ncbi:MAG: YggS family pyridoxal phosphate-dependent enzyme [Prevotella sp.]
MNTLDLQNNYHRIAETIPATVTLVAVSKYQPSEAVEALYRLGHRVFGESHVQELSKKHELLPQDIQWHFIGHLQTNKVKYIAPYISMIESVDSVRLIEEINKQALKCNRVIDILLELHVAQEETKYGLTPGECRDLLRSDTFRSCRHVRVRGLMTIASNVDDEQQIQREFQLASDTFHAIRSEFFSDAPWFDCCSWGMSSDYPLAIAHGSNMVRVGTGIFGERQYK